MDAGEKFSRLSPAEMAAARTLTSSSHDEGQIVAPVPFDAPPLDVTFKGRKPDEVLWFLTEKRERLFAECRWNLDRGAKEVRPACYVGNRWRLRAYPPPRPLYNLDKVRRFVERAGVAFRRAPQSGQGRGVSSRRRDDRQCWWRERDQTD